MDMSYSLFQTASPKKEAFQRDLAQNTAAATSPLTRQETSGRSDPFHVAVGIPAADLFLEWHSVENSISKTSDTLGKKAWTHQK